MRSIPPAQPPSSTYRLQIRAEFGFDDAAAICGYLADLGVSHVYLSPILQPVPGSAHGYDVIDHAQLSADAGGRPAFERLVTAAHAHGLKLIADVVPNHMAVPTPVRLNAPLWAVLREGPDSAFAPWFDIDWTPGQVLMPVLGNPIGTVLADGELSVDHSGAEPVLRYYEHEFPLREGTAHLPLPGLLSAQFYRLAWWRVGTEELNYRRFFDVTTLAAIRVEDTEVFDVSHALLADLCASGSLDGLRIDHPDGLADPRGYLRLLARATGGTWVVAEKILEGDEPLPADWPCAGTTGYDALNVVGGLFVDPAAQWPLTLAAMPADLADDTGRTRGRLAVRYLTAEQLAGSLIDEATHAAKSQVLEQVLPAEIRRLVQLLTWICSADLDLRDNTEQSLRAALVALLVQMDRYRAYAVPGEPVPAESAEVIGAAVARAHNWLPGPQDSAALDAIGRLALDTMSGKPLVDEFVVRFQQTCGPVMAKGIEDTLFYRWTPLLALNEVGADPHRFGYSPSDFHAYAESRLRDWPVTMTTLSTHDTKRSEDARARLYALTEVPDEWATAMTRWTSMADELDPPGLPRQARALLWQTVLAIWDSPKSGPPDPDRVVTYLHKALREAKEFTSWTSPDEAFEADAEALARAVLSDPSLIAELGAFVERLAPADRSNVLAQKLIQLTMPGVPDVYQGCEIVDRSLVDPDNRRPVDYARRVELLPVTELEALELGSLDAAKLLVTTRALNLRRAHPEWFGADATYAPVPATSEHAIGFARGTTGEPQVVTVATRLWLRLAESGGWGSHTVDLPAGSWVDLLTGTQVGGGPQELGVVLAALPVALLIRI